MESKILKLTIKRQWFDLINSGVKIEKITIGEGREEWGAVPGVQYFIIHLGEKE